MHPQHSMFFRGMARHYIPGYGSEFFPKPQLSYTTPTVHDQATHASSILWMPHCHQKVFDSLRVPLTSLAGADLVKAWLEVVKFHAVLWSRNIKLGDPNLWNAMYDKDLKSGVLVDYDFSISRRQLSVSRSGTMPFMALDLLDEDVELEVERQYRHELEAFIWLLSFIFERYENGESLGGTAVEGWMTSHYRDCLISKVKFRRHREQFPLSDPEEQTRVASWLLFWSRRGLLDEADGNDLASIWSALVKQLRAMPRRCVPLGCNLDHIDKLVDDLGLESLSCTFLA